MDQKKLPQKRAKFSSFGVGEEKEYFVENLSMILSSGLNVMSALQSLKAEMRTPKMKKWVQYLIEDIDAGVTFSKALKSSGLFPAHVTSLVRIGEETGKLPESLKVIAGQQQKDRVFKSRIRSAMMYPVLVLIIAFIMAIGIIWFLLPRLSTVFIGMNMKMPWITQTLINFGTFIQKSGFVLMAEVFAGAFILIMLLFVIPQTKASGQALLFRFPGLNRLLRELELSRFGFIFGTLLNAGLPIVEALESLQESATMRPYKKLYMYIRDNIREGNSFQKTLKDYPHIDNLMPPHVQQMIISAEQSGKLPGVLIKIGQNYEEKSETTTKDLAVILEPIMLIIVWLAVLMVALSVIMPIYSLIGGLDEMTNSANSSPPPPTSAPTSSESAATNSVEAPADTGTPAPTLKEIKIINPVGANVYQEANAASAIIGVVNKDQILGYTDNQNGMYKIDYTQAEVGWIKEADVEIVNSNENL